MLLDRFVIIFFNFWILVGALFVIQNNSIDRGWAIICLSVWSASLYVGVQVSVYNS